MGVFFTPHGVNGPIYHLSAFCELFFSTTSSTENQKISHHLLQFKNETQGAASEDSWLCKFKFEHSWRKKSNITSVYVDWKNLILLQRQSAVPKKCWDALHSPRQQLHNRKLVAVIIHCESTFWLVLTLNPATYCKGK